MSKIRFQALSAVESRTAVPYSAPSVKVSDFFGQNVFGFDKMKKSLSPSIYEKLLNFIEKGQKLDSEVADAVALAMKKWAMDMGATYYTHWFQPLTGATAEKHDAFYDINSKGEALEKFKGSALSQQEPDASSFPSGGIRSTFEARGYTAWDPTSPAFVYEMGQGKALCIPSIFVSYTGEALDYKTPLLKTEDRLDKAATAVVNLFDRNVKHVYPTLGWEQEYFVIDKALYTSRPDLVLTGRTVFGHSPAKGQQLDDHYFGSIPERIQTFMRDFETESHKLGIPVRTRHNEVGPGQYEVAPTFEAINLAVDHNQLLMDVMEKVALRHNLKVLFHEKPFDGVNGSGKHNNWSMATDTGKNLLSPSTKPKENLVFLTFFINTIMAVYEHADLLRAAIASAGNDHRLGANEAPPAIMSVFIGKTLTAILDELESNGNLTVEKGDNLYMKLGISKLPPVLLDNTDRNRTSPFAFTGSKFEFRAVGSQANVSGPMTMLNAAVADQLNKFKAAVDAKINDGTKTEMAVVEVLREIITASKAIRFEGNNYGEEWVEEAKKRGLSNEKDTPRALGAIVSEKSMKLFKNLNILNEKEAHARYEVLLEQYILKIQIEARVIGDLAVNHVVPTAIAYQNKLITNVKGLKELGLEAEASGIIDTIKSISGYISNIKKDVDAMVNKRRELNTLENVEEMATRYCDEVKSYFDKIRYNVDKLELTVDDEDWPLAKYREMLFLR